MLSGFRVLDFSGEPGHLAGKILGDLGADVIQLEPPGGDRKARRGPFVGDRADPNRSLPWLAMNTSKRGITLDTHTPRGVELVRSLARTADVVLETAAPGSMQARGIGYEDLVKANPRLVYCAITPFGQTGPYANFRAGDLVTVAMGGNPSMTGDPDRAPVRCSLPVAYLHAGPEAAAGIAMALLMREDTGRGQFIDISMQECQTSTLITGTGMYALSGHLGKRAGARLGKTREIWAALDGHISFGLRSGAARTPNLVATVEYMHENRMAPNWLREYDWANYNHNTLSEDEIRRLEEAFGNFFASKTMRELYEEALKRRIMLAPCNNAGEILDHPQLRFREFFARIEYPEFETSFEHPNSFAKSSEEGAPFIRCRAPMVGEHNADVYAELGVDATQLSDLASSGII